MFSEKLNQTNLLGFFGDKNILKKGRRVQLGEFYFPLLSQRSLACSCFVLAFSNFLAVA